MAQPAVVLRGVSKRYGTRAALEDVSFEIPAGRAVGYLGPNGAGKTTTLRLLAGLARPDRGSVELLGLDPMTEGGRALQRAGILVETPGCPPYLHGRDLLEHVAAVKGVPRPERARAVRSAADGLGVSDHLDRAIGGLSTGLTRRLLLAVALVGDPEVLLLDEPTLGLDPAARSDLRRRLAQLARDGRTLLLSTHLLEDVEEVCEEVLFLRSGILVGHEPVLRETTDPTGTPLRALRLEFFEPVEPDRLTGLAGEGGSAEAASPLEVVLRFRGDDRRQAEVVAEAVRRGLPLVSASVPASDLDLRYLAKVGREEAG